MLKKTVQAAAITSLIFLATILTPAQGQAERAFSIESANSQLNDTVYFLNAVFDINLPHYIVSAIEQGFNLPLVMEIEVYRVNSLWFDEKVVYIKQQYRVSYHSLLDEFSVFNVNSGLRIFHNSLDRAITSLTVMIDYPGLDNNALKPGERYNLRLRFGVDSAELPLPLKSSSLWQNDWNLKSEWFEWELKP